MNKLQTKNKIIKICCPQILNSPLFSPVFNSPPPPPHHHRHRLLPKSFTPGPDCYSKLKGHSISISISIHIHSLNYSSWRDFQGVRINMPSHILPVSNPNSPPSPSPMLRTGPSSASMLIRSKDDLGMGATRILISPYSEENSRNETKPLIPRPSSQVDTSENSNSNSYFQQKRRRRAASDTSLLTLSSGQRRTYGQNTGDSETDTYLITRLCLTLLKYLGVGYRWIMRFLALNCYSLLLFPGFVQVGYHYYFSKNIRRGIVYGDQPRNKLDLYLPKNREGAKPVVAFVTGGAWIIGYKAWGSLLGQQLSERDIIVACIDYRNFPQGTISDMIRDAAQGVSYVCNNIAEYGGDPNRIYLMGQSAGAHIAACALLEQAIKEASGEKITWGVSQIKAYFGLSGGYNFYDLVDHFHSRGLYRRIFLRIMEGEESLRRYSPEVMAQDPSNRLAVSLLPPVILFHGTGDYSIPSDASKNFAETLRSLGVQAESILYEGKTHTDVFLQDPMRGGKDELFEDLLSIIHAGDPEALARDAKAPPNRRLVPECMLKLARAISPF